MTSLSADVTAFSPLVLAIMSGPGVDPALARRLARACAAGCSEVTLSAQNEVVSDSSRQPDARVHRLIFFRTPQMRLAELLQCNVGQGAAARALEIWRIETRNLLISARQNRAGASLVDLDAALAVPDDMATALWNVLGVTGAVQGLGAHISRPAAPRGAEVFAALADLLLTDAAQSLCDELAASSLRVAPSNTEDAEGMLAALHEVVGQRAFYNAQSDALTEDLATSRSGLKTMLDQAQSENIQLQNRLAQADQALALQQSAARARDGLEIGALGRSISNLKLRIAELEQALALSRRQCGSLREAMDATLQEKGALERSQKALQQEYALLEAQLHAATTQNPPPGTVDRLRSECDALRLKLVRREQNLTNRLHEFAQRREIEHRKWEAKSRAQSDLDIMLHRHVKKLQADLEATLACVDRQQQQEKQMQGRIMELETEVENLNKTYAETMSSTSWRITAPLRQTKLLTTRIFD